MALYLDPIPSIIKLFQKHSQTQATRRFKLLCQGQRLESTLESHGMFY